MTTLNDVLAVEEGLISNFGGGYKLYTTEVDRKINDDLATRFMDAENGLNESAVNEEFIVAIIEGTEAFFEVA
jgi:hypothetical protein